MICLGVMGPTGEVQAMASPDRQAMLTDSSRYTS